MQALVSVSRLPHIINTVSWPSHHATCSSYTGYFIRAPNDPSVFTTTGKTLLGHYAKLTPNPGN